MTFDKISCVFFGLVSDPVSTNYHRLGCFRQLGIRVQACDIRSSFERPTLCERIRRKLTYTAFSEHQIQSYNKTVINACSGTAPDFVWFEWPTQMESQTILQIRKRWPSSLLVCFQDDNPFGERKNERPRWKRFIDNISLYDVHCVKRHSDILEFTRRGAKRVLLFQHGVYEPLFHPDTRPASQRGPSVPVSFVGTALDHRVGCISKLILKHKVPLRIYGARWNHTLVKWLKSDHFSGEISSGDYTKVIWDSEISLAFVSSSNHDEYNGRTFEIPGSGGFFLGERTLKHQELFEEGKEAEFFSSTEECAEKVFYYLKNITARRRIAAAGYERCIRSDYRLVTRVRDVLESILS